MHSRAFNCKGPKLLLCTWWTAKIDDGSTSCVTYVVEWIRFRIRSMVKRKAVKEDKQGFLYIPERLLETRVGPLEECKRDANRLRLAHDVLRATKSSTLV